MRLRSAVLQIPPRPSVPPGLPLYKNPYSLTRSESTLTQVLIPQHFISFIRNTYIKPGGGDPSSSPKVWQLVTSSPRLVIPCAARNLPCPTRLNLSFRAQRGICFFFLPSLPHYVSTSFSTSSSRQELPSQICYRPLAPVFAHQPNPSFRAKRGISLLGPRERSPAQAPKQGAQEKWQSAPYL